MSEGLPKQPPKWFIRWSENIMWSGQQVLFVLQAYGQVLGSIWEAFFLRPSCEGVSEMSLTASCGALEFTFCGVFCFWGAPLGRPVHLRNFFCLRSICLTILGFVFSETGGKGSVPLGLRICRNSTISHHALAPKGGANIQGLHLLPPSPGCGLETADQLVGCMVG